MRKRSKQQHAKGRGQASLPITAKVDVGVQRHGTRYNASTADMERTMSVNKGAAEERGAPGVTKGNKRPGCEQMQQREKERCTRSVAQSSSNMDLTGREALVLTT